MAKTLVIAAFLAFLSSASSGQSSVISFGELGFSMAKPDGWFEIEKRVLDESVAQLDLPTSGREKLKRDDDEAKLLILFTRYLPDSRRGVNPKIEVRLVPTAARRELTFDQFQAAYTAAFRSFAEGQISYSFLQEPVTVDLKGGKGVYQSTRFILRTSARTEYTIRSRTLAIPQGPFYFQISMVDELSGEDLSPVFDELVKSIKIGNHN